MCTIPVPAPCPGPVVTSVALAFYHGMLQKEQQRAAALGAHSAQEKPWSPFSSPHSTTSTQLPFPSSKQDNFRKGGGKSSSAGLTDGCSEQNPDWTPWGSDRHLTRPRGLAAAREPNWILHKRPEGSASETTSAGSRCCEAKSTQPRADVT